MMLSSLRMHCWRRANLGSRALSYDRVNKEELQKFASVGSDWWDPNSKSGTGPLHEMNPVRVDFVRKSVAEALNRTHLFESQQLKGLNILDVGCGGGLLSESLARLGANMTSIDPAPENIKVASSHSRHDPLTATINYKQSTIEEVLASGQKFDVVCALEVIEHVDDPRGFIQACSQCVQGRDGAPGNLFVSTMNRTKKAHLMAVVGAEYLLGLLPPGTHEWNKFITPEELRVMVESTQFERLDNDNSINSDSKESTMKFIKQNGIVLKPVSPLKKFGHVVEWGLSDTDVDVNYISHFVKL